MRAQSKVNKNATPLKYRSLRGVAEKINNMDEFEGYEIPKFKKRERSTSSGENGIATFVYSKNGKRMELPVKNTRSTKY